MMDAKTRQFVWRRANFRCEYCHLHQDDDFYTFHLEHIIAKQHGGSDGPHNRCVACRECNFAKGPNVAGYLEDRIVPLFNPRRQKWASHFAWNGPILVGKTLAGKVTVRLLDVNSEPRVQNRLILIEAGTFPPQDDPCE